MLQNEREETSTTEGTAAAVPRPVQMHMTFQRGMLKTLGINLYASIGKVLVEFIANAYDSDATEISIILPVDRIRSAREAIKVKRRADKAAAEDVARAAQQGGAPATVSVRSTLDLDGLTTVLPDDVQVTITDNGHGMTWQQVQDNFLPLNRARRMDENGRETRLLSPKGRFVMGRKGVGKLAGFGAAGRVVLRTKRAGESYATVITMTDSAIGEESARDPDVSIPVRYEDNQPLDDHGTTITLSRLKADAFKSSVETISGTVANAFFALREGDFRILMNDVTVKQEVASYEFIFPETIDASAVAEGTMADDAFEVPDVGIVPFKYYIGFRKRSQHLPASRRGARIYCNNRLAAGPTLFNLGTGMHSFHSVDYMECIVEADALDRGSVDLISTSRTQFQEGNDVFDAMQVKLVELLRMAIGRHGAFREREASREVDEDPEGKLYRRSLEALPKRTRTAAGRLLDTMAAQYGVGTPEFKELAPIILNSVNATEVLARLVTTNAKPETITVILGQLHDLSEIEAQDVLKLYRGRRGGITKLQKLELEGNELWKRKGMEKELHQLLKDNPWLIRPEFSGYLTSDAQMGTVVSKIAAHCGVDAFAKVADGAEDDIKRPDLVFVMSDRGSEGPHVIRIVELKSPSIPLTIEHYRQLETYLLLIERWCRTELARAVTVHGYLIGAMPPDNATAQGEVLLLEKMAKGDPDGRIRVVGLTTLINDAWNIHVDAIRALEAMLDDEDGGQAASASQDPPAPLEALPVEPEPASAS